jgi:hypothetical protein
MGQPLRINITVQKPVNQHTLSLADLVLRVVMARAMPIEGARVHNYKNS